MSESPLGKKKLVEVNGRKHIVRERDGKCLSPDDDHQLEYEYKRALRTYGVKY